MVKRCVVVGCDNVSSNAVSLHQFPAQSAVRRSWVRFVRRTRPRWTANSFSFLCSEHFEPSDFVNKSMFDEGYARKLLLKADAVPSVLKLKTTTRERFVYKRDINGCYCEDMSSSGEQGAGKSDPYLQELTDNANRIEKLFDCLAPDLRLEALDVLQNLVNHVMSKMTHGRVCSVRFVPVPAAPDSSAVSPPGDDVSVSADIEVKQEPLDDGWSHEVISSHSIGSLQTIPAPQSTDHTGSSVSDSNVSEPTLMTSTPKSKGNTRLTQSPKSQPSPTDKTTSAKRSLIENKDVKKSKKLFKNLANGSDDFIDEVDGEALDDSGIGEGVLDLSNAAVEEFEEFIDSETSQDLREEYSSASSPESKDNPDVKYYTKTEPISSVLNWSRTAPRKRKKKDTSKLPFHCEHCSFATSRKYSLDTHMSLHTGDSKYKCSECDKCFTAASSLKRHMMIHDGVRPFNCPVCQKKFVDVAGLRTHSTVHTGERFFKCDLCPKAYTNHANLARHKRVHTGEMPYVCKYDGCDAKFRDLSSLKLHVLKHTGEKPYGCPFCEKKFKTSSDFRRHERTHTQERNYKCTQCGKTFIQGYHLKQHLKIHADLWLFSCELCNKRFRTKASLQHHMKGHAGVKDYRCEKCCSAFTTKRYLNDHYIAAHTNAKPYKCDVCHKGFNHISNMKRHKRMHSNEFRYKCKFCGRGFKYINSLQYHEGIHTGEKKVCEKCGFSCRSVATIKAHRCSKKPGSSIDVQKEDSPLDTVPEVTNLGRSVQEGSVTEKTSTSKSPGEDVGEKSEHEVSDGDRQPRAAARRSGFVYTPRKSKQRAMKMIESITEELNEEQKPLVSKLRIKLGSALSVPKITSKSRKKGRPRRLKPAELANDKNELPDDDSKDNIELKIENSFSLTSEDQDGTVEIVENPPATSRHEGDMSQVISAGECTEEKDSDANDLSSNQVKAAENGSEANSSVPQCEQKESSSKGRLTVKDNSLMEDVSIMQEAYGGLSSTSVSSLATNGGTLYVANELHNGVLGSGLEDLERCMPVIAQVYSVRE